MSHVTAITDRDEATRRQWLHWAQFMEQLTKAGLDPVDYQAQADRWWPVTRASQEVSS